ncbi:MAG: flagellar biosynthetic protein FliR [Chlamydiia bacterium]|nr:flagellar biosynthetic protein FliR [Chlamydiia bacterium]
MDTFTATESYLSLLLSLPHLKPMTVLAIFFLTLGRILPIVSLAPFLGSKNIPGTIRILFSISLVAIFLPQNLLLAQGELPFSALFIGYFLKEITIGFILGFLSMAPFMMAQMAGSLIDFQRGASSLQVSDPTTQTQTGPVGLLFNFMLLAVFFSLNGPFLYLNAVADSYRVMPVDAVFNAAVFDMHTPFWSHVFGGAGMLVRISVQLAAPALIGILLTDLVLGIANRLAPQVQIVFLGMALKSWVGLALMTAAWGLMLQVVSKEAISWMQTLNWLVVQMKA